MLRIEDAAARLIAREGIDVVHSHFGWPAGVGGSLAAQATGTPLVTSLRGTDVLVRPDLAYGLRLNPGYDVNLQHLFRTAARVLVATSFMRIRGHRRGRAARQGGDDRQGGRHRAISSGRESGGAQAPAGSRGTAGARGRRSAAAQGLRG